MICYYNKVFYWLNVHELNCSSATVWLSSPLSINIKLPNCSQGISTVSPRENMTSLLFSFPITDMHSSKFVDHVVAPLDSSLMSSFKCFLAFFFRAIGGFEDGFITLSIAILALLQSCSLILHCSIDCADEFSDEVCAHAVYRPSFAPDMMSNVCVDYWQMAATKWVLTKVIW